MSEGPPFVMSGVVNKSICERRVALRGTKAALFGPEKASTTNLSVLNEEN